MKGFFITLEGSEGVGKSTQMKALAQSLAQLFMEKEVPRNVLLLREPGGTPLGEKIRHLLKYAPESAAISPRTELLLFAASRAELVDKVVLPALEKGDLILCDRFLDSTTVYQGVARALEKEAVTQINHFATGGLLPDLTLLLDMDVSIGSQRAVCRAQKETPQSVGGEINDRMEQEDLSFYQAVRHGYLALAAAEPERWEVIDASAHQEQVTQALLAVIQRRCHGLF